jgi:hypothetical protein
MSLEDLRRALEPDAESDRPFAAVQRLLPRPADAPMIAHLDLPYRQWDGPRLPWKEDFGKAGGQVYSRDGDAPVRSCNEVEVAKRLRRVREHAYWISCYRADQIPAIWRAWARSPGEAPQWLLEIDRAIRVRIGSTSGGIPDVVAWNDDEPVRSALLVECKGAKESFKEGQEDWVTAALQVGLSRTQFAVAVRMSVS